MPEMLTILSGYINDDDETKKKIKGAMIYPVVMMASSIAATGSLMFFVLPKFTKIYEAKGAALPKLTAMLVSVSQFFANKTAMGITVTIIVALAVGFHFWRQTPNGRMVIDWIKLHIPIFRTMFIDAVLTRNMRIMATMVNTGVSILDAIEVMKTSCDNYYFDKLWTEADSKIRDGYQLSESILLAPYSNLVAPGIIQMLKAGEKSGKLGDVAAKISVFYEKKLAASIKTATAMIEPIMIIVMGSVIGTIAIALLLPVFKISSVMRG
jgi:type IV pilus assembly protein PilC